MILQVLIIVVLYAEVMGNNADNLALYAAISCGSELVITNNKTGYDEEHVIKELIRK